MKQLLELTEAQPTDMIVFCAESKDKARGVLGNLRLDIGDMLGLRKKDEFAFVVVTEFPLFEYDEVSKRHVAMHHPFTRPKDEDLHYFESEPSKMRAKAYDVVLNGIELGSGSIRIHERDLQAKMFKALGLSEKQVENRFGFMLKAFEYGVPPHGGFAFGLDRLIMMLIGASTIREVIAFPKMRDGSCAMMDSPSEVDPDQLEELSITLSSALENEKSKKTLDLSMIEYVSDLARLELTPQEKVSFAKDLHDVIAFADQIEKIDVSDVPPLNYVFGTVNRFREDISLPSLTLEETLKNAPEREDAYFFVPKTVE